MKLLAAVSIVLAVYAHQCLAVDGSWSKWGKWSDCSVSCGLKGGIKWRSRDCTAIEDGEELPASPCTVGGKPDLNRAACNKNYCPGKIRVGGSCKKNDTIVCTENADCKNSKWGPRCVCNPGYFQGRTWTTWKTCTALISECKDTLEAVTGGDGVTYDCAYSIKQSTCTRDNYRLISGRCIKSCCMDPEIRKTLADKDCAACAKV